VPENVKRTADIGMRDLARQLNFAAEALDLMGGLGGFKARRLHRHALVQFLVLRFVDFAHAAARDKPNHLEASGEQLRRLENGGDRCPGKNRLERAKRGRGPIVARGGSRVGGMVSAG